MLERSNVDFPLWRKKVDASFLKDGITPIPGWLLNIWDIKHNFKNVRSKNDPNSIVTITFDLHEYKGYVTKHKHPNGFRYRFHLGNDLTEVIRERYLMSYMRMLEAELNDKTNNREIEKQIPFWEFIDIEHDSATATFHLNDHFTQKPLFPELFARLVGSPSIKRVNDLITAKNKLTIHKQDWKPRAEYKYEFDAKNVIYMLLDKTNKLIYVGETSNLVGRFNQGHTDIKDWEYFKYNVLPPELAICRVTLERMVIRDLAALLDNKQDIHSIKISNYKLANRKIDK